MVALEWGIKASLVAYIHGQSDGAMTPSGGAVEDGGVFAFPPAESVEGEWRFHGCVRITAHGGAMDVRVSQPWLLRKGTGGELTIADAEDPDARIRLATIAHLEECADGSLLGTGLALALPGSDLFFFGPYGPGTPLEDLSVTV